MPAQGELTRHHALARRYFTRDLLSGQETRGYTAADLFKFYGLMTGLFFALAYTYVRYWELFNDVDTASLGRKLLVLVITGIPTLLALPALLGFLWWASGALVRYARWQMRDYSLWRWFWFGVLNFYTWVLLDLFDLIHPAMSRKGLAPAPNLILLFDGKFEFFQFQWGYFLLYLLFYALLVALHWSYFMDGLRELRFYTNRMHRYGVSVLTGFAQTNATARSTPVCLPLDQLSNSALGRRGAPRLNPELGPLSPAQASAVLAADVSGAIILAPGQNGVLFVDLAAFTPSQGLESLADSDGRPMILFDAHWPPSHGRREDFVVPLRRGDQ